MIPTNTETNNIVDMNNTALNPIVTSEISTGDIKPTGLGKSFNANTMIGIGTCVAVGAAATELVERVLIPVGKKVIGKIKGLRKAKDEVQEQENQEDPGKKDSSEKNEKNGKSGK